MKVFLLCALALLLCMGLGTAIVFFLLRKKRDRAGKLLLSVLLGLLLLGAAGFGYLSVYYHAAPEAAAFLVSDASVSVSETGKGLFFDGPGCEAALIFYPGAKVEESAYAPLLRELAQGGLDCFLVRMPLRMAVLDMDAAEQLRAEYDYRTWLLAGHSLGGAVAANLLSAGSGGYDALVLLASYPTKPLPEDLRLLSIYGSEDGCLDREAYEAGRAFWPAESRELLLSGGNHAGYGLYGPQRGDGTASISPEEQQNRTTEAILDLIA